MKNSQKKLWVSIGAIALSLGLFATASIAATDNLSGYTRFKEILFSNQMSKDTQNATSEMTVTVARDGSEVLSLSSVVKHHDEGNTTFISTKTSITRGEKTSVEESWLKNTPTSMQSISKSSAKDRYTAYINEFDHEINIEYDEDASHVDSPAKLRLMNAVIDTVVGDTKNQFSSNGDTISIHLEGAQIPELAQLALTVILEEEASLKRNRDVAVHSEEMGQLALDCVSDLKDLRFDLVSAEVQFSGNTPINAKFDMTISGMDLNGAKHKLAINGVMTVSDIGNTKADTIDLESIKDQVDIIDTSEFVMKTTQHGVVID